MNNAVTEIIKCCKTCDFSKAHKLLTKKKQTECTPKHTPVPLKYKCPMYIPKVKTNDRSVYEPKDELLIMCEDCGQVMHRAAVDTVNKKIKLCDDCMEKRPISVIEAMCRAAEEKE